jgi:virginiamycin B lyase
MPNRKSMNFCSSRRKPIQSEPVPLLINQRMLRGVSRTIMTSVNHGKARRARFAIAASLIASGAIATISTRGQQVTPPPAATSRPPKVVRTGVTTPGVARPLNDLKPETIYTVEGSPDWSVVTKDAVWVSSARVNHVVQLLPSTGKPGLIATVQRPCSGLAYGWGAVWVPSCGTHHLVRLDEATGNAITEIPADPANSEGGITVGDGSIWMVVKPSMLVRVDPNSNTVVSSLELPTASENPAFGDGFVWISSFGHDQLLKIDPKLNKVIATIPVGPKPRFLTIGAGSVWTLNQGDGTISRVDMKTDKLVATIACGIPGEGGEITFGAGSVWTALFDFPLTQVDATNNLPVRQWAGKGGDGVRFGFGSVWLSNLMQGTVWRISPNQK